MIATMPEISLELSGVCESHEVFERNDFDQSGVDEMLI